MVKYLKTKKNSINKAKKTRRNRNRNRNRKNKNYIIGGNGTPPPQGRFWVEEMNDANGHLVYRCIDCGAISGTAAASIKPYNPAYFTHRITCRNRNTSNTPLSITESNSSQQP